MAFAKGFATDKRRLNRSSELCKVPVRTISFMGDMSELHFERFATQVLLDYVECYWDEMYNVPVRLTSRNLEKGSP